MLFKPLANAAGCQTLEEQRRWRDGSNRGHGQTCPMRPASCVDLALCPDMCYVAEDHLGEMQPFRFLKRVTDTARCPAFSDQDTEISNIHSMLTRFILAVCVALFFTPAATAP